MIGSRGRPVGMENNDDDDFDPTTHMRTPEGVVIRMNRAMRRAHASQARRLAKQGVTLGTGILSLPDADVTRDASGPHIGTNPKGHGVK